MGQGASCGTKALRTNGALLSNMPARSTDGARVVDEAAAITSLLLEPTPGEQPAHVKRPKGIEKQFRLSCRSCGAHIAYRSAAPQREGKANVEQLLYVLPAAVRERPPSQEELQHRPGTEDVNEADQSAQEELQHRPGTEDVNEADRSQEELQHRPGAEDVNEADRSSPMGTVE